MKKLTFENLPQGEYLIKARLKGAGGRVSLFENHRRFLLFDEEIPGIRQYSFACALKSARFQKKPSYTDNKIELTLLGDADIEAEISPVSLPTLYLLGDSTVCDQEDCSGGATEHCCGWGQTLPMFFGEKIAVSNHAEQGTHTADCLSCHLPPVLEQLKRGDIAAMQFGHNDQKAKELTPGVYEKNLVKISEAVKKKGAKPVICTPINRFIFVDGKLNDYLLSYSYAAKRAAERVGAQLIDLHSFTSETYLAMGDGAEKLFYHSPALDRTHPCDIGGVFIGRYVFENIII